MGYIAVNWARKGLDTVKDEVKRYAEWADKSGIEGLFVEGIYFDETPNHVSEHGGKYLDDLTGFVKNCRGVRGGRLVSSFFLLLPWLRV